MKRAPVAALAIGLLCGLLAPNGWARGKEYSVWVVPSGRDHDHLKKRIAFLSQKYGTPEFEPHVTLIGLGVIAEATDDGVARQVESLAKTICPYKINLQDIGTTDDPFRSLYWTVEQTAQVMAAGRLGLDFYRRVQKREPASPTYFPHLSLLYGNLSPAVKERIISEGLHGRKRPATSFTVSALQLWVTSAKIPDWPKTWEKNWHLVKEFPLGEESVCPSRP